MAGSAKRVVGTLLFLIALVSVLAFYFVVFAGANQVSGVPGTDNLSVIAIAVSVLLAVVLVVMIILLAARGAKKARREAPETPYFMPPEETQELVPAFEDIGDDMAVYDVWTLPIARRAWGGEEEPRTFSFYFPLNVESGVYVNDYIRLDDSGARLKLRTLLAGPMDVGAASFVVPKKQAAQDEWSEASGEWADEPEEAATPYKVAPLAPRSASRSSTGTDFMTELERRFDEKAGTTRMTSFTRTTTTRTSTGGSSTSTVESAYYDYKGDDHPVIEVEGIGAVYAKKLSAQGIETTGRLCYESSAKLSKAIDVPMKTIETWQSMAQLMKVSGVGPQYAEALARAGIEGIDELKRRSPARLADQVNEYLDSLQTNVLGTKITERRVAGWQAAAKSMRRVRQTPPQK